MPPKQRRSGSRDESAEPPATDNFNGYGLVERATRLAKRHVGALKTFLSLALAVLAVVPFLFAVSVFFRKRILRTSRLVRKTNSRITASYNESIVGVRTSKVFVRQEQNLRDFDQLAGEMSRHSVHNAVLSAIYLPIVLTLGSVAISLALALMLVATTSLASSRITADSRATLYSEDGFP